MATGKRLYWIRLMDNFFDKDEMDFFMAQPNGANYIVLYQMLLLMTLNTDGKLQRQIGEVIIPYDIGKIKRDCKYFSEDTILVAMEYYKQFGLIYEDTDGALVLTEHEKLVGSETDYAEQKREQRKIKPPKKFPLLSEGYEDNCVDNVHMNVQDDVMDNLQDSGMEIVHTDIRDKRLDIRDKNKEINNTPLHSPKGEPSQDKKRSDKFIPPTLEEVKQYFLEKNIDLDPEEFFAYYDAANWKRGNTQIKKWKSCVVTWQKRESKRHPSDGALFTGNSVKAKQQSLYDANPPVYTDEELEENRRLGERMIAYEQKLKEDGKI